jgi:hypothetical protein
VFITVQEFENLPKPVAQLTPNVRSSERRQHSPTERGQTMTIPSTRHFPILTGLALALALAIGSPVQAQTTEPATPKTTTMDHSKMDHSKMDHSKMDHSKMDTSKMEHSKMMMERCQGMMADMKSQDAELTQQVARMNSATGEAKINLLAEIITHMSEQRAAMNTKMAGMHMEMMKHMQMGMGAKSEHAKMKGMGMKSEDMPKDKK